MTTKHFATFLLVLTLFACKEDDDSIKDEPTPFLSNTEKLSGGEEEDFFTSLVEMDDFIYQFGSTLSGTDINGDFYLVKFDLDGTKIWEKNFGLNQIERGTHIAKSYDGNLYLLGSTESMGNGQADIYLLKVDTAGTKIWEKTFGTAAHEIPEHLIETSNSEICIAATQEDSNSKGVYLVWTDLNGNFIRDKKPNASFADASSSIIEDGNKNLFVFGYTELNTFDSRDFQLIKTNSVGDLIWAKSYGGDKYELSTTLLQTPDNSLLLIGHSASTDPHHSMYVLKVDTAGNIIWEKNYGGAKHDGFEGGIINGDGNYVFAGISNSFGNSSESMVIITTDKNGTQMAEDVIRNDFGKRADDIIQVNNYYYLAGRVKSEAGGTNDAAFVRRVK